MTRIRGGRSARMGARTRVESGEGCGCPVVQSCSVNPAGAPHRYGRAVVHIHVDRCGCLAAVHVVTVDDVVVGRTLGQWGEGHHRLELTCADGMVAGRWIEAADVPATLENRACLVAADQLFEIGPLASRLAYLDRAFLAQAPPCTVFRRGVGGECRSGGNGQRDKRLQGSDCMHPCILGRFRDDDPIAGAWRWVTLPRRRPKEKARRSQGSTGFPEKWWSQGGSNS